MLLVKAPVPVPSVVLKFIVVGFWLVLQHTPLAVTVAPPSEVMFPPEEADVAVIEIMFVVVKTGSVVVVEGGLFLSSFLQLNRSMNAKVVTKNNLKFFIFLKLKLLLKFSLANIVLLI